MTASSPSSPAEHHESAARRVSAPLRRRLHEVYLPRLLGSRESLFERINEVPDRMQRLTNQVRLVLELCHDYEKGIYRNLPWYSLAGAVLALLYFVSPADLLPDYIPAVGALDDLFVLGLATRILRKDLIAYCQFKGYDPAEYFPPDKARSN